jgi:hypothetical protein
MEPHTIEYYESRIAMLEEDIGMFGPAGNDLSRLDNYKKKLASLQHGTRDRVHGEREVQ